MNQRRKWAKAAAACALLVAFGAARMPLESSLHADLREAKLRTGQLDLAMRDQIGQRLAVAVMGGFRSLVASMLSLKASISEEACGRNKFGPNTIDRL